MSYIKISNFNEVLSYFHAVLILTFCILLFARLYMKYKFVYYVGILEIAKRRQWPSNFKYIEQDQK